MRSLPKYRNSFFTRLILSYTVFAVVLIGLAGGYLYSQANRLMVDEIARDSQIRLVTAKDYVEQNTSQKIRRQSPKHGFIQHLYTKQFQFELFIRKSDGKEIPVRILSFRTGSRLI